MINHKKSVDESKLLSNIDTLLIQDQDQSENGCNRYTGKISHQQIVLFTKTPGHISNRDLQYSYRALVAI